MGQNNDTTEHGDPQGHQGGTVKITPRERKRQAGYPPVPTNEDRPPPPPQRKSADSDN